MPMAGVDIDGVIFGLCLGRAPILSRPAGDTRQPWIFRNPYGQAGSSTWRLSATRRHVDPAWRCFATRRRFVAARHRLQHRAASRLPRPAQMARGGAAPWRSEDGEGPVLAE